MEKRCAMDAISVLLDSDPHFYIDMIQPLKSGIAHAVSVAEDGVLIHFDDYLWYMMAKTEERALTMAQIAREGMKNGEQLCCHDNVALQKCAEIVGQRVLPIPVVLSAYLSDKPFELSEGFEFKPMTMDQVQFFADTYTNFRNMPKSEALENAKKDILRGVMYVGYVNGEAVGYIGTHKEGTMGLLEVMPEHRRKGYGTLLEKALINEQLSKGITPFGHILETNVASIALQKAIGLWVSDQDDRRIYWMA
jgi:GNAT superfamily N-acetyltransferase